MQPCDFIAYTGTFAIRYIALLYVQLNVYAPQINLVDTVVFMFAYLERIFPFEICFRRCDVNQSIEQHDEN